ncbi:MAG: DUF4179 domain-containing protein [Lachnospiraceae bacterium]|nr:DUF4179 domain-containing protein [Lachnospiraceae bacterium]
MKNDIYTLLNEIDHQPDFYETMSVSMADRKKWKKDFSRRKPAGTVPSGKRIRYAAAAAGLLLLAGAVSPVGQLVYAQAKAALYNISELLGSKKDLEPYRTVIGRSVTRKGITVTLNDVILDEEAVVFSVTATAPEALTTSEAEAEYLVYPYVYINGKMASAAGSGVSSKADDYNMVYCGQLEVPNVDLSDEMNIAMYFNVKGNNFDFLFSASAEELMADTTTIPLNQTFLLPDQTSVTFTKYTSNSLTQRIYFKTSGEHMDYDVTLSGTDDLGNEVEFSMGYYENGIGRLEVSAIDDGCVKDEASRLTLTAYAGRMQEENGGINEKREAMVSDSAESGQAGSGREKGSDFVISLK